MTMKLTELKIAPRHSWSKVSASNPMVCSVKLESEGAIVESAIPPEEVEKIIALVSQIVTKSVAKNVADFISQVTAVEASAAANALPAE